MLRCNELFEDGGASPSIKSQEIFPTILNVCKFPVKLCVPVPL